MKALQASSDDSRLVRHKLFVEGLYKKYLELYGYFGCRTTKEGGSLRMTCEGDSVEASVFEFIIDFMMGPTRLGGSSEDAADFSTRSDMFAAQSIDWGLLSKPLRYQDEVFCRCRVTGHLLLAEIKESLTMLWLSLMMGACLILYFGVEHRFMLMDIRQRRDALSFLTLGAFSLTVRSLLFQ
eukprot:CAMPEP_0194755942 /NCGR_PEP_ID=MMETSP0323_2-20130528/9732_1 /TAXON_ID=2866 ORGANISM="Crypthecodinium cohnii, Strain Seligo" /NCGR_SAMPLE_ID=MMETSP0323_2 /ASSEMBLY_ACC=CAM_ASM_000346 /LENGTH=181 /DNA_ID=CAMNT_0039675239 /DNA_START=50 /DNA_END=595 /DNA_ORIENTATION=+